MRYYLATLFWWNNSQKYLWYPVEMSPQSNNDTTRLRLINNMEFPHIWLAQNNITDINRGNITQTTSQTSIGETSHTTSSLKG
jgi:hypothetical protein